MKPYSIDLREKVVSTYHAGNISVRKLAANFGVGKAFVQKMLKQYQQEGHLNPGKQGGGKKAILADYSNQIIELVEKYPDATLAEYCEYWRESHKQIVSESMIFNPIEHWWSQLKAFIKTFSPKTTRMVDILISVALKLINPIHLRNWFANCCYCTS